MGRLLVMCLLASTYLPSAAAAGCSKTLTLGWTEIPPSFYSEHGRLTGIDVDILRAVFRKAGCSFTARPMPHKRYVMSLKAGDGVDMVLSASKNDERAAYAYFSPPYRRERILLYTTPAERPRLKIHDLDDVTRSGIIVTAGLGMWLGPAFADLYNHHPTLRERTLLVEGYPAMLRALVAGRADVLVGDSNAVPYQVRAMGLKGQVVALPVVVHDNDVHLMFSRKTVPEDDVRRIDKALAAFVGSQRYMAILARYTSDDPDWLLPKALTEKTLADK